MRDVLLLGAGMVAGPVVDYLGRRFRVHVVAMAMDRATADAVNRSKNADFTRWSMDDARSMDRYVQEADLVISLLPAWFHAQVAQVCIEHGRDMVTASYVSDKMRALDDAARKKGVLLLNEIGVDPGIDHMSAMRVINEVKERGGKVIGFRSYTGGLPAPKSNTNPWGYKLSWSPRSVVTAAGNSAHYLLDGREVTVRARDLFRDNHTLDLEIGRLEAYPNRDSYPYIGLYGLDGIETMYRGTLRYPGWCELWDGIVRLGMLENRVDPAGMTYAGLVLALTGRQGDPKHAIKEALGLDDEVLDKLEWIGLFKQDKIPEHTEDTMDVLAGLMSKKLVYGPGEQDMIVMRHEFNVLQAGTQSRILSTLIDYGDPDGFSAMASTVGLPVAMGAEMILDGRTDLKGVQIPTHPQIYNEVLPKLESMGIVFKEEILENQKR